MLYRSIISKSNVWLPRHLFLCLLFQSVYCGDDRYLHCLGSSCQGDAGWTSVYLHPGDHKLPGTTDSYCFPHGDLHTTSQWKGDQHCPKMLEDVTSYEMYLCGWSQQGPAFLDFCLNPTHSNEWYTLRAWPATLAIICDIKSQLWLFQNQLMTPIWDSIRICFVMTLLVKQDVPSSGRRQWQWNVMLKIPMKRKNKKKTFSCTKIHLEKEEKRRVRNWSFIFIGAPYYKYIFDFFR